MKKYVALLILLPLVCFAQASPQQLFHQYFALSNALAKDSVSEAKKAASEFSTTASMLLEKQAQTAEQIKVEDLPQNRKESVRQSLQTLVQLSKTVANVDKLDQMRKPFEEMTTLLGGLQSDFKVQADEYYCPMVKKVWLQSKESKKIQNPYGGKSMADCGEKRSKK
jgi:hypothetical protein